MQLQLLARTGHPDLLDLPWDRPLEAWDTPRLAQVPRGISRHVVRFVRYETADPATADRLYAIKELPARLAHREYRLLTQLREQGLPVVEAVGVVTGRESQDHDEPLDAALITRHLEFSLPYRFLFAHQVWADLHERLLDALTDLLVRLHLSGFLWGDCSLSNTLFRRDAGTLTAYLVDAETGELHPSLTDGQRDHDLELATVNVAGELADLAAAGALTSAFDPFGAATELRSRYEGLWDELTREERVPPDEHWRVDERLRRLNELGFDVNEIELVRDPDGWLRLRLQTQVVEKGHHRKRLRQLTGLDVQEEQARRLLNDIAGYTAWLEGQTGQPVSAQSAALRWLEQVYEPAITAVPRDLRAKREPAQLFHELLDHRYFLSEEQGRDVPMEQAVTSYLDRVLRRVPDERAVVEPSDD